MGDVIDGPGFVDAEATALEALKEGLEKGIDLGGFTIDEAYRVREWLETAVKDAGAKVTDAGFGVGAAHLGIELGGERPEDIDRAYSITIWPRAK